MPSQKTKKPAPSKVPIWKRRSVIIAGVILLVLALGAAYAGYTRYQQQKAVAADLARFEAAARDLQIISSQIKNSIKPASEQFKKECTTQSREFEQEPIVCVVRYSAVFGVDNQQEANKIYRALSNVLRQQKDTLRYNGVSQLADGDSEIFFSSLPEEGQSKVGSEMYTDKNSTISCPVSYELVKSTSQNLLSRGLNSPKPNILLMTVDCGAQTSAAIYALDNGI